MFENIINFFKKLITKEENEQKSKEQAKERLHLLLMQDRSIMSCDFLESMKQEIIEVIKKYIEVDEDLIDVKLINKLSKDNKNASPTLYANIPISKIKTQNIKKIEQIQKKDKETQKEKVVKIQTKDKKIQKEKVVKVQNKNKEIQKENAVKIQAKDKETQKGKIEQIQNKNKENQKNKSDISSENKKKIITKIDDKNKEVKNAKKKS